MPSVQKVGRAVMAGMKAEGLLLQQFNEPASGQQVFHLHFHLLPCWTGVAIRPPGGPFQNAETLKPYADKIVAALAGVSIGRGRGAMRLARGAMPKSAALAQATGVNLAQNRPATWARPSGGSIARAEHSTAIS